MYIFYITYEYQFHQVGMDKMTSTLVGTGVVSSAAAAAPEGDRQPQQQTLETSMFHRLVYFPVGQIVRHISFLYDVCLFEYMP
jgi:hypothetical protein